MSDEIPRMCGWCGLAISKPNSKTCDQCRSIEANSTNVPGPEHALTGHRRYRDKNGVYRWEPIVEPVDETRACESCDAEPWEVCRTASGKKVNTHVGRRIPRQCRCGAPLKTPGSTYCQPCADAAQLESWRQYAERRSAS